MLVTQDYTEKSFLVFDDEDPKGTIPFKDTLKALGGKYGANFTWDSEGKNPEEEKRSAYMFPMTKKENVVTWIDEGCDMIEEPVSGAKAGSPSEQFNHELLMKIYKKICAVERNQMTLFNQVETLLEQQNHIMRQIVRMNHEFSAADSD